MSTISKICSKAAGETRNVAIDMRGKLDDGEFILSPPTVIELVTNDLTLASKTVNAEDQIVENEIVPAGQAIQFKVSGGVAGKKYTIRVTATTTAVPAQVLIENIMLRVIPN